MRRFLMAQRAIAAEIGDARRRAGMTARELSLALRESHNYIWLIESLGREVRVAELLAIARACGVRGSTLLARVERRLRN